MPAQFTRISTRPFCLTRSFRAARVAAGSVTSKSKVAAFDPNVVWACRSFSAAKSINATNCPFKHQLFGQRKTQAVRTTRNDGHLILKSFAHVLIISNCFQRDRICQCANVFNFNGHLVVGFQPARRLARYSDTVGRAGQYHRSRQQGGRSAQKFDQRRHIKNHVVRVPILDGFAVENGAEAQRVRVRNLISREPGKDRAGRMCQKTCRGTIDRRLF
jgi:hypothetical protein